MSGLLRVSKQLKLPSPVTSASKISVHLHLHFCTFGRCHHRWPELCNDLLPVSPAYFLDHDSSFLYVVTRMVFCFFFLIACELESGSFFKFFSGFHYTLNKVHTSYHNLPSPLRCIRYDLALSYSFQSHLALLPSVHHPQPHGSFISQMHPIFFCFRVFALVIPYAWRLLPLSWPAHVQFR